MRSFVRLALVSILAALVSLIALPTPVAAQQILETYNASLTTYQPTSSTLMQDIEPQHTQRGVNLDGSLRAPPFFAMQIAGNPFENAWRGQQSQGNLRLDVGAYAATEIDIALPCTGLSWVVGRSYNSAQQTSGGSARDSNGYQGKNWAQSSQPEIVLFAGATNDLDVLYLIYGADRYIEFKRQALNSNQFKSKSGAAGCFQFAAGSSNPDTYTYTDQIGNLFVFFGFNAAAAPAKGLLWKMTDPAGNVSYAGNSSTASTAISSGYDGSGRITTAFDSVDRRFSYSYSTLNSVVRLTQVKCEVKDSGTWSGSPVNVRTAVQVDYAYYGTGEDNGDAGNLKKVTITTRLNDSGGETDQQVKKKYYRYWKGTYNPGGSPDVRGYPNSIKSVFDFESVRRMDLADDSTLNDSYDSNSVSDATLASYATLHLEYDSSHRVNSAVFNGQCGCGAGSMDGTFTYSYGSNGSYTNNAGYDTTWCKRTVIAQPDGSYITQYFDEVSQGLSRVTTDADPAGSPTNTWVVRIVRDSKGTVTDIDTPASITGYTHNTTGNPDGTITVSTSAGLIWKLTRTGSGTLTGFMTDKTYQQGSSGTAYFDGSVTYDTSLSKTLTDVTVVHPLIASRTVYSQAITSGSSGAYTTSFAYTDYSGASQPLTVEKVTVTEPVVSTGTNGSNSANTTSKHLLKDGKVDFEKNENAIITYHAYTDGQETTRTEDADTTSLSPPSGFSHTGTPLAKTTTTTISNIGFKKTVAPPINNTQTIYESVLADQRLVRLQFTDLVSTTYYGPVTITVVNQAGKVELLGLVSLSGNTTTNGQDSFIDETKTDPILAVSTGTLARMTTSLYDDSGTQLSEERSYFTIPGSGDGSSGTNYDSSFYGYDSMGRRWRTKERSGTIQRTVFDALGRTTDAYSGTNDHTFSGGESVNADNMVKVENLVYDGGSGGGNSLLTQRTLYIQSTTTGQRITTYTYDYRGRRIVDLPPLAPFTVHLYDNMSRETATGQYSSSSGLTASTDPTSTSSNRLALNETLFDEMGRVWKTIRHKITQSNGADADTLESLSWHDAEGRLVKTKGDQVSKTTFDRIGRATDEFMLAKDTDSGTYSNAIGITGSDIVLEQHETRYDQTQGTVILRAAISRFHSDVNGGSGETTGALDTNADGGTPDVLKLTAADVKGRAQVTASWYDSIGRETKRVEYGTNAGSTFDRPGTSEPTNGTTSALMTKSVYNDNGTVQSVASPNATLSSPTEKPTAYFYDDEGRRTKEVKNYDVTVNSGDPNGTDQNVTVAYEYAKGLRTTMTAVMHSSGDNQITSYAFGTATGGGVGDSKAASGHLLQKTTYPDGSSDNVALAYNAQSQEIWKQDQAGNVIETDYDTDGRVTEKRVTTLASGFDGAVKRIETTYDGLGRKQLVTQYDNATVGSGSVVDEVKYTYDDWGNVATFRQDRNSAVDAIGSVDDYTVSYSYAKSTAGRNAIRRSTMTLPSSKVITFNYRSRNGLHDDEASRVTDLTDGGTTLVTYDYNGTGQVVGQKYPEPNVQWKEYTSTAGAYPDLDDFNRVVKSRWTKNLGSPVDFYHVELTYDSNSNITSADDQVHSGFDVKYTLDGIDRLTEAKEGTLSSGSITSTTRDEQWTLSHTGNWDRNKVDLNGDGDFVDTGEVDDTRVHDKVNQLNTRDTDSNSSVNYTLGYDGNGNLTDDNNLYKYVYDAFNRLRKVNKQSNALVAEYRYNGLGYKIAVHADTDSDGDVDGSDKWYYDAFDDQWRPVARFRESDTSPKEEFVYHAAGNDGRGSSSYIDLVVLRNKDANTAWTSASDGTLEERIYYCQNWRADVSAIVGSGGTMKEWVKYSAYGIPFGLPGGDTDSDGDCDTTDVTQVQTWINGSTYDVRGDIDLDGDVDATDKSTIQSGFAGLTLGRGMLSASGLASRIGYASYSSELVAVSMLHLRSRTMAAQIGRFQQRDPAELSSWPNLQEYVGSEPVTLRDPYGLRARARDGVSTQSRPDCDGCAFSNNYMSNIIDPFYGHGCANVKVSFEQSSDGLCWPDEEHPGQCHESGCSVRLRVTYTCNCDHGCTMYDQTGWPWGDVHNLGSLPNGGSHDDEYVWKDGKCGKTSLYSFWIIGSQHTVGWGGPRQGTETIISFACDKCTYLF